MITLGLQLDQDSFRRAQLAALAVVENAGVDAASGSSPMTAALKRVLLRVRAIHVRNFMSGGQAQGGWKALSWWSGILRKLAGKKVAEPQASTGSKDSDRALIAHAFQQIAARSKDLRPLNDTGSLMRSLQGGAETIEEVGKLSVTFGTRHKDAEVHQFGGSKPFQVDFALLDRLQSTIGDRIGSGAPKTTPTGRISKAKAQWNIVYFALLFYFQKRSGTNRRVPERRFVYSDSDWKTDDIRGFEEIITETFRERDVQV